MALTLQAGESQPSSAAPKPKPQPVDYPPRPMSSVAELLTQADALYRCGMRSVAAQYIGEAVQRLRNGESGQDVPWLLLHRWQAADEKSLAVRMAVSLVGWSSYFAQDVFQGLLTNWIELEPSNAEPYLRFGLLAALRATASGQPLPEAGLKALQHAESLMDNDRSKAALAIATQKPSELAVPYDGGEIYVYPDLRVLSSYVLLEQSDWFEPDLELFRALIRPGDRVLDLGANIGTYSFSAARRVGSEGRVISVEPAGVTFALLNRSSEPFANWTPVRAAVGDHGGVVHLEPNRALEMNKVSDGDEGEEVPLLTVDELTGREGVETFELIKMDVEGLEIPTINGAERVMGVNNPIIFFELKEGKDVHLELVDVFRGMGYGCYTFLPGCGALVEYRPGRQMDGFILNMIAVRPDNLERFEGLVEIIPAGEA